jgi:hypothetical protein
LVWRPERVQVVVLAEWTSREETRSRVTQPDGTETGFARFVYCLGYGEPQLVAPEVKPNNGTPQYWKLFQDTVLEHRSLRTPGPGRWRPRSIGANASAFVIAIGHEGRYTNP